MQTLRQKIARMLADMERREKSGHNWLEIAVQIRRLREALAADKEKACG
jgi:hypothetical protein